MFEPCFDSFSLLTSDRHTHGHKFYFVSRLELSDFPKLSFDDRHRANKTTEARPIGSKNHRHVTGEIYRSHSVGIVVNVRRMQARFATIFARPVWTWSNQAHTSSSGVKMHFPLGCEEHLDVLLGEKFGRSMWTVQYTDLVIGTKVQWFALDQLRRLYDSMMNF